MKKILISILFITYSMFAQEELNYAQQKELIQFLESSIKKGDNNRAFELGLIYEDGILDSNNKKKPNIELATKYFITAFESKDYRSVFKLIVLLKDKKEYKKVLELLDEVIKNSPSGSMKLSTITTYGTFALDYFPKDKDILIDALYNFSYLSKEELENVPTTKFVKAILMGEVGNVKEGEQLLNEACFSPKAPKELKDKCFNAANFEIVKTDVKKSITEPCCTNIK